MLLTVTFPANYWFVEPINKRSKGLSNGSYSIDRKLLREITRFRTSSHSLRIETGRHQKPIVPAPKRICVKCTLDLVEDEIHCLIVCPSNSIQRNSLFLIATKIIENFQTLDDISKFTTIMECRQPELLSELGKFLKHADVWYLPPPHNVLYYSLL